MTKRRVLVTRPQPGADKTASRLSALGYDPIVMPLTETVSLPHVLPKEVPELILATSPQAFRHLSPSLADAFKEIPLRVTGKATATAARERGFLNVKETGGDAARLLASLGTTLQPGTCVLYLAGHVRRPELEAFLAKREAAVSTLEVYDTVTVSYSTDKIFEILTGAQGDAVLLTSVNCALRLGELDATREGGYISENTVIICLSERISEAARSRFPNLIAVAAMPTEDALLDCLSSVLPPA
jgi:uroporphyrinogen-III synthase